MINPHRSDIACWINHIGVLTLACSVWMSLSFVTSVCLIHRSNRFFSAAPLTRRFIQTVFLSIIREKNSAPHFFKRKSTNLLINRIFTSLHAHKNRAIYSSSNEIYMYRKIAFSLCQCTGLCGGVAWWAAFYARSLRARKRQTTRTGPRHTVLCRARL